MRRCANQKKRKNAARAYQPKRIRLLLVAEAPPEAINRYFYFEKVKSNDWLFQNLCQALYGIKPTRDNKKSFLTRLRESGVFLIDLSVCPRDGNDLARHLPNLLDRCRELRPAKIILIKVNVFDIAYKPLCDAHYSVVEKRIPFPASGQQRNFAREFSAALKMIRWHRR